MILRPSCGTGAPPSCGPAARGGACAACRATLQGSAAAPIILAESHGRHHAKERHSASVRSRRTPDLPVRKGAPHPLSDTRILLAAGPRGACRSAGRWDAGAGSRCGTPGQPAPPGPALRFPKPPAGARQEVPRYQPALRKTGRRANPGTCNCGRILGSMRSKKCRPTTRRHALQRAARRIPVRIGPPHGRAVPACRQTGGRGSLQCLPSGLRRSRTGAGSAAIPGNAAHGSSTRMRPRISQSMLWTRGRLDHRLGHRPGGAPDAT